MKPFVGGQFPRERTHDSSRLGGQSATIRPGY